MDHLARDWRTVPLAEDDRAVCRFAARLTHEQSAMGPEDVEALREAGWSDEAVHDVVQVAALFNYYNRVAHGLGVENEPEEFVRPWGEMGLSYEGPSLRG